MPPIHPFDSPKRKRQVSPPRSTTPATTEHLAREDTGRQPSRHSSRALLGSLLVSLLVLVPDWATAQRQIDLILIHATGGPGCKNGTLWHAPGGTLESNLRHFATNPNISYHYLIGRDGKTVAGVPESEVAHHAKGHNAHSIGVELVNDGDGRDPFPEAQIQALVQLLKRISQTYGLTPDRIKGHSEVDDRSFLCGGRRYKQKIDPGGEFPGSKGNFPWQAVREALR